MVAGPTSLIAYDGSACTASLPSSVVPHFQRHRPAKAGDLVRHSGAGKALSLHFAPASVIPERLRYWVACAGMTVVRVEPHLNLNPRPHSIGRSPKRATINTKARRGAGLHQAIGATELAAPAFSGT